MLVMPPSDDRTLIDDLLAEQRRLTAVEKFSRAHDRHEVPSARYRDLLPAALPEPGRQYAFEVNLDQCSGCKACVTACHSLNGLDDGEAWRDIGGLVSDDWRQPFTQTITTACHHCADPGCLNGCPVLAYEKDSVTGIVRHLDDQCIGCQYCVLKCPYEVPKYSGARGIVRKCDMCSQRLAVGEAPACVQACPNEAIRITLVATDGLNVPARSEWLPAAPDPAVTRPTTRFVSERGLPKRLVPAAADRAELEPAHWPLVWMLVLTQAAAGVFLLLPFLSPAARLTAATTGCAGLLAGLFASVFHLGRPLKAWRAFLGWRRSWMSREILAFGAFAPLALSTTAALRFPILPAAILPILMFVTAAAGMAAVFCSAMIYHDTRRVCWSGARSIGRFSGTMLVLGLAAAWPATAATGAAPPLLAVGVALAAVAKLILELRTLRPGELDLSDERWPDEADIDRWMLAGHARLLGGALGLVTRSRLAALVLAGITFPLVSLLPGANLVILPGLTFASCLVAELAERHSFFRAVTFPRMPGL